MGLMGHLCAAFITVFGGFAIGNVLRGQPTAALFSAVLVFALVRGFLRYAEQACNHFIAFKLLALILDQFPIVLILHRAISIVLVFFLAIHIFVFHKKLR